MRRRIGGNRRASEAVRAAVRRPTAAIRASPLAVAFAVALAACGGEATTSPAASPTASASVSASVTAAPTEEPFPIVSVETKGGECAAGRCTRLINIEADGRIHEVIPKDQVLATVSPDLVEALRIEVERANYPLLESRPFTGTCPTAVDGQETIYTFHAIEGDQEIASCKVAIDPNHPLFQAVAAVLAAIPA